MENLLILVRKERQNLPENFYPIVFKKPVVENYWKKMTLISGKCWTLFYTLSVIYGQKPAMGSACLLYPLSKIMKGVMSGNRFRIRWANLILLTILQSVIHSQP